MTTDSDIVAAIDAAFVSVSRPEHFTNFQHCEECLEHDQTLLSRAREDLTLEHLGQPGWDPVCFATPTAKAYLMPQLARLALQKSGSNVDWYGSQLIFHLYSGHTSNDLWQFCNPSQKKAVASLLLHLIDSRSNLIDKYCDTDDILRCYELRAGSLVVRA
jgi:hypothetical protein